MNEEEKQKLDSITEEDWKPTRANTSIYFLAKARAEWEVVRLFEQGRDLSGVLMDAQTQSEHYHHTMGENVPVALVPQLGIYVPAGYRRDFPILSPHVGPTLLKSRTGWTADFRAETDLDKRIYKQGLSAVFQEEASRRKIQEFALNDIHWVKHRLAGDPLRGLNIMRRRTGAGIQILPLLSSLADHYLGEMHV